MSHWTDPIRPLVRVGWAVASVFVVESLILALAIFPAALFYQWHLSWALSPWAQGPGNRTGWSIPSMPTSSQKPRTR